MKHSVAVFLKINCFGILHFCHIYTNKRMKIKLQFQDSCGPERVLASPERLHACSFYYPGQIIKKLHQMPRSQASHIHAHKNSLCKAKTNIQILFFCFMQIHSHDSC